MFIWLDNFVFFDELVRVNPSFILFATCIQEDCRETTQEEPGARTAVDCYVNKSLLVPASDVNSELHDPTAVDDG